MSDHRKIPVNNAILKIFRSLADRAFDQTQLSDGDLHAYLSNLLADFAHMDQLYPLHDESGRRVKYLIDMQKLPEGSSHRQRQARCQYIGDYSLFILGMFPESLSYGRVSIPHSYFSDTGRRSYLVASELETKSDRTVVFRKLADKFEHCVVSLNWVREYTRDPFYQYMLRQFRIT